MVGALDMPAVTSLMRSSSDSDCGWAADAASSDDDDEGTAGGSAGQTSSPSRDSDSSRFVVDSARGEIGDSGAAESSCPPGVSSSALSCATSLRAPCVGEGGAGGGTPRRAFKACMPAASMTGVGGRRSSWSPCTTCVNDRRAAAAAIAISLLEGLRGSVSSGSGGSSERHMGHVLWSESHGQRHLSWKTCLQGSRRMPSLRLRRSSHIGQETCFRMSQSSTVAFSFWIVSRNDLDVAFCGVPAASSSDCEMAASRSESRKRSRCTSLSNRKNVYTMSLAVTRRPGMMLVAATLTCRKGLAT
mmetsp:Transcript_25049/g.50855  ORF Transcript_25049/g.50855 Transcript_25049/m.50855 type:complete len:302 (-) Transcript_25049:513-1418(-)